MGSYHHDYKKAIEMKNYFINNGCKYEIFGIPNARIWKWWVGTKESYEHELKLIYKRKKNIIHIKKLKP